MDIKTKEERTGNSQHTFNHPHGCGMGWRLRIWEPDRQSLQVPRGYQHWEMSTHYKRVTHAATDNQKPSNRLFSSTRDLRQTCKHLSDFERFRKRKVTLPALDKSTTPNTQAPRQFNRTIRFCLRGENQRVFMQEASEAVRPCIYQLPQNIPPYS